MRNYNIMLVVLENQLENPIAYSYFYLHCVVDVARVVEFLYVNGTRQELI